MANFKPMKWVAGKLKQFSATDTVPTNNLGSGTANASTYLSGDQTYKSIQAEVLIKESFGGF